jgi:hypothetical protein
MADDPWFVDAAEMEAPAPKDVRRRGKPYVWVTHITGLIAGSSRCYFSAWFKAHHKPYVKREDPNFDLDAWTAEHDSLVHARATQLRADGWRVGVEDDNSFTLKGHVGIVGGKADLLMFRGTEIRVRDVKTGKERDSDHVQVRIYQYAIPRVIANLKGRKIEGELEYKGGRIVSVVPPSPPDVAKLGSTMEIVCGEDEPPRVPSRFECLRCDIASCPDRDLTGPAEGETDAF